MSTEDDFVNIASYLPAIAEKNPYTMAVVAPHGQDVGKRAGYVHYTMKQLNDRSDAIARGFESAAIEKGTRVALMVKPGLDFFTLTFALFKVGAVPVIIDPGIGPNNMKKCLAEAEPQAFIGIPKAQVARMLFKWGKKTIKISITVGKRPPWGGMTLDDLLFLGISDEPYEMAKTRRDDVAAILFTSGSTGIPKGTEYTHGIFDAQIRFIKEIYQICPGEVDLASFPLFALFGPALGMTSVIPDMDATRPSKADPKKIIQAIEDFGATNMFASPALINVLGRYGERYDVKLPSLKRVISAGAPASLDSLERFSKMLKSGAQIFTPYGATEALPVCSIGSDEILQQTGVLTREGKGACVGFPVPGVKLEIIKISDEIIESWSDDLLLPTGEIGEIVVKGEIVTRKYYNREDLTALAKIPDPQNGGFYHRMGDVGYKDEKGRVWFCGRKSHRVTTSGGTLFTIPCEAIFNNHPNVFRTALVGIEKDGATQPVLCVELEKDIPQAEHKRIKEELMDLGSSKPHTTEIKTILFHPSFPVDIRHNAKISREKLSIWARSKV